MLASRGLDISFVRTHFDEIKTSEENPEDVRRNDCLLLGPYGLKPDDCYHLSNLPNSKWYEALDSLRQMLTEKGIHAQAELLALGRGTTVGIGPAVHLDTRGSSDKLRGAVCPGQRGTAGEVCCFGSTDPHIGAECPHPQRAATGKIGPSTNAV